MSRPTHYIFSRKTGDKLWLYDVKEDKVYQLDGKYYTTMGKGFTKDVLANRNPAYLFKKIMTQLENK